jgi:glyceraldehyde 3-phosphate dehydrogenase
MKKTKIAINGVGRIGRTIIRAYFDRIKKGHELDIELVALNNPGNPAAYVHFLKYDSVHGHFPYEMKFEDGKLTINDHTIPFFDQKDPAEITWSDHDVDVVIDSTGIFTNKESLGKHLGGSVKKVVLCAPGSDIDGTFVVGINHDTYDHETHHIISNASCTTNCLAPVAKVINDAFGIESGFMTTVHAYTNDQNILDNNHKDFRRARAAALSMIPTTTGAAKAVGLVLPELKGKLDGFAIRVPTPNVSLVDLTVNLTKTATAEQINSALLEASKTTMKGILGYSDEPLVSQDYIGATESSFVDSLMTNVIDNTAKVVTWYDNEVGFSNRVLDLTGFIGQKL